MGRKTALELLKEIHQKKLDASAARQKRMDRNKTINIWINEYGFDIVKAAIDSGMKPETYLRKNPHLKNIDNE